MCSGKRSDVNIHATNCDIDGAHREALTGRPHGANLQFVRLLSLDNQGVAGCLEHIVILRWL